MPDAEQPTTTPQPAEFAIGILMAASGVFDQTEFDFAYPDGVEHNYWTIVRNRILLSTLKKHRLNGRRWMEIGCGRGVVVRYLREKGIDCQGVELADVRPLTDSDQAVWTNQDACDLPVDSRESCTGLMLFDVIEHVEQPVAFVKRLLDHFPNAGDVVLTVPARPEIWSNYDDFYGHFRRYEPELLEATLHSAGLTPTKVRYFFHSLYPAARVLLSLQRERAVKITAPRGWQKIMHQIVAAGFLIEDAIVPGWLRGTSLLCVASRPTPPV